MIKTDYLISSEQKQKKNSNLSKDMFCSKFILNGSSFSPFNFHSTFISYRALKFCMCGENWRQSIDTEES